MPAGHITKNFSEEVDDDETIPKEDPADTAEHRSFHPASRPNTLDTEYAVPGRGPHEADTPRTKAYGPMMKLLSRMHTSLNAQLGVICHVLRYPPLHNPWPDSVTLEVFVTLPRES